MIGMSTVVPVMTLTQLRISMVDGWVQVKAQSVGKAGGLALGDGGVGGAAVDDVGVGGATVGDEPHALLIGVVS